MRNCFTDVSCFRTLAVCGLLLVFVTGCGSDHPPTFPVTGRVEFPDGKPLAGGSIEFETKLESKLITARGTVASDGRFTLGTYQAEDGALPGTHRVAVFAEPEIGTGYERPDKLPSRVIDDRFSSFEASGLKFEIRAEPNEFTVVVEPPK